MGLDEKMSRAFGSEAGVQSVQRVQDLFADSRHRQETVVVYRRSRLAALPKTTNPVGIEQESADGEIRAPRTFKVLGLSQADPQDLVDLATPANEESMPAALPVPRRRRPRDALHAPGKVHHVVFAREAAEADQARDMASAPVALLSKEAWRDLRQGLQAIDRTLQQIHEAQRFQLQFDRLLPARQRSKPAA